MISWTIPRMMIVSSPSIGRSGTKSGRADRPPTWPSMVVRTMSRPGRFRLLSLLLIGVNPALTAEADQPKVVDASLVIMTPMGIASIAVLDEQAPARDPVIAWIKPVFEVVEARFAEDKGRRTIVVQVTLHPDRAAEVDVAGRPALTDAEVAAILKVADAARLPRSRLADCALRIVAKVNGGDPHEDRPLVPPLVTPNERKFAEFRAASLPAQLTILRRWARAEALPLLAQMATEADPKFVGVRNLGKTLKGLKPKGPIDVKALTDQDPDYWRAMLEMARGNPLVPAVRVVLHVARGEIDAARRIARTLAPFDQHQSGPSALLAEFQAMADLFAREVEARIRKGIALHDAGKFGEALDVYDGLLKDYPRSAWAHYERYQTLQTRALQAKDPTARDLPDWDAARKAILEADPFYGSMARATNQDELYDLMLRKETEELFKDKSRGVQDILRYADIAVDLGHPGFAALIYWDLLTNVNPAAYENRDLIEDVLYCFEKLGAKEIKQNFKGDHAAAFARIDAERAKRRKESLATKALGPRSKPTSGAGKPAIPGAREKGPKRSGSK